MTYHILKSEGKTLAEIYSRLESLKKLQALFAQYVDPLVAKHCSPTLIEKDCLILIADNGHWATQMRFHIPDLLANLRKHPELCALKSIQCKTRPNPLESLRKKMIKRKMKKISYLTAQEILKNASNIQDEKLRKILEKIASRT